MYTISPELQESIKSWVETAKQLSKMEEDALEDGSETPTPSQWQQSDDAASTIVHDLYNLIQKTTGS